MTIDPFRVAVDQTVLDDLHARLDRTRLPNALADTGWDSGTEPTFLRDLLHHWRHGFDWRAQEAAINRLAQFRTAIDGRGVHFIHERGMGPTPYPLLLTHGWPDSVLRFQKLIPLLTDPAAHGGDPADAFDVVAPSLPGYAFSDPPDRPGVLFRVAGLWAKLMAALGYTRYGAHGGDWGSIVTEFLGRDHAAAVAGIHLTDVSFLHLMDPPKDLSPAEARYVAVGQKWQQEEGAYAHAQGTKPQTLAVGLNDSPAGLAAWIAEKYRTWTDCGGAVETRFTKDELLTTITLYWVTGTIRSSFQLYYDAMSSGGWTWFKEAVKMWVGSADVPAGFALFPKDLRPPPREWAERFFNVQRWTEMPRGGRFAAHEEPELLAEDLRAFFRPLRQPAKG